jgi:hypothetical protein
MNLSIGKIPVSCTVEQHIQRWNKYSSAGVDMSSCCAVWPSSLCRFLSHCPALLLPSLSAVYWSPVPRTPQRGINSVSSRHSNRKMYTARNITFWHKGVTDLGTADNTKRNVFAFRGAKICSFCFMVQNQSCAVCNSEICCAERMGFTNVKTKSVLSHFN